MNSRSALPRPTRRSRAWRINGAHVELIPIGTPALRRLGGARDVCEVRRKADDRRLAILRWRGRHDRSTVELVPELGCARAALDALRALAPAWIASTSARGRLGIRHANRRIALSRTPRSTARLLTRGVAVAPALDVVALPADYAARTGLPPQPEPARLVLADVDRFGRPTWLDEAAARAWIRMRDAASDDRVALELVSGFRHAAYQTRLFQRKFARGLSLEDVLRVNAAPGFSEHHTGRAIDITTPGSPPAEEAFEATPAFAWLQANAPRHGFRLSYPRDNPHGVVYEPWHWLYVAD